MGSWIPLSGPDPKILIGSSGLLLVWVSKRRQWTRVNEFGGGLVFAMGIVWYSAGICDGCLFKLDIFAKNMRG
jgi:hypothetical protein